MHRTTRQPLSEHIRVHPTNSPDLNTDFSLSSGPGQQEPLCDVDESSMSHLYTSNKAVWSAQVMNVDELKQRLAEAWQNIIDQAIDDYGKHIQACCRAKGHQFEYLL